MNKTYASYLLFLLLIFSSFSFSSEADDFKQAIQNREAYRTELHHFRQSYGGSYHLPTVSFFLFGMGNRNKLIYKNGEILNAITGELLYKWRFKEEVISPQNYSVALKTLDDKYVFIVENEIGVYLQEKNKITYQLTDINGKTVLQGQFADTKNKIDLSGQTDGIYSLTLVNPTDNFSETVKIVKTK